MKKYQCLLSELLNFNCNPTCVLCNHLLLRPVWNRYTVGHEDKVGRSATSFLSLRPVHLSVCLSPTSTISILIVIFHFISFHFILSLSTFQGLSLDLLNIPYAKTTPVNKTNFISFCLQKLWNNGFQNRGIKLWWSRWVLNVSHPVKTINKLTQAISDLTAEDEVCFEGSGSAEDNEFDAVVGALEEILLGDVFQNAQKGFCDEHCGTTLKPKNFEFEIGSFTIADWSVFLQWLADKFTDGEENKIEYTDLFQTYTIIIEKSLDDELKAKIPVSFNICNNYKIVMCLSVPATHFNALFVQDFDMTKFEALLVDRKGENYCIFSSNFDWTYLQMIHRIKVESWYCKLIYPCFYNLYRWNWCRNIWLADVTRRLRWIQTTDALT